ncbi:hypothetical protein [Streptosporangium sp. NPDC002607]
MKVDDRRGLIADAKKQDVSHLRFIGGEPALHPDFVALLSDVVDAALGVENYSNLVAIRDEWWEPFGHPG